MSHRSDNGHLQDGAHTCGNLVSGSIGKGLGAVASLQEESAALGGLGEAFTQDIYFAGKNQRRTRTQFVDGGLIVLVLAPSWLLGNRQFTPQV